LLSKRDLLADGVLGRRPQGVGLEPREGGNHPYPCQRDGRGHVCIGEPCESKQTCVSCLITEHTSEDYLDGGTCVLVEDITRTVVN
jgi:hypothetical protein